MTSNVTTKWTVSPNWQRPFLCLSTIPQVRPAYPWGGLRLRPTEQMDCRHAPVSGVSGPALGDLAPSTGAAPARMGPVDVG